MDKTHLSRLAMMGRTASLPDLQMAALAKVESRPRQYKLYRDVAKIDPGRRMNGNLFRMNKKTKSVPNLVHMSDSNSMETENWMFQTSNIFPYTKYYSHLTTQMVPRQGRYQKKKNKKVFSRYDMKKPLGHPGFHSNPLSSLARFSKSETNFHKNLIRYAKYSKSPIKP